MNNFVMTVDVDVLQRLPLGDTPSDDVADVDLCKLTCLFTCGISRGVQDVAAG